jgi:hypothetical protein
VAERGDAPESLKLETVALVPESLEVHKLVLQALSCLDEEPQGASRTVLGRPVAWLIAICQPLLVFT